MKETFKRLFSVFTPILMLIFALALTNCAPPEDPANPIHTRPPSASVDCSATPGQCGNISVSLPTNYWSSSQPAGTLVNPMALPPIPTNVSHFRVVAFPVLGGTAIVGPCTEGCVDITDPVTVGSITVPLGTYNVCSLAIGIPSIAIAPTLQAGGCTLSPVVVTSGPSASATITHVLSLLAVTTNTPPTGNLGTGPNFAYTQQATVMFTSTGLPTNIALATILEVYGGVSFPFSSSASLCTDVTTSCLSPALGIPNTTVATPFFFLATVDASKYAVSWTAGPTLWMSTQTTQPPATAFNVLSGSFTVDKAPPGSIDIHLE